MAELETMLSSFEEARATDVPIAGVKAHYLLGKAYEKSGWNKKAIEQYEATLEVDPNHTAARTRLEQMSLSSEPPG